ncbi:p-type atpase [Klebsormidium nitens]|uniref:P-type atpase n=1 Tax=Klebsormidium nitens TaxID=105231 RepID=A0A1Y1ICK9_KLENI|nr:p-type atpase [Klebsormidium nitens]|eukprot:GAQ86811.1 p-type atpase [Klebsormidium nitens]
MPAPTDQPARPERPGALLPLLNGVLATTLTFTFGVLGLINNWRVPQLPHLFFGLLTSSAVSALLTTPLVLEWLGRRGRRRAAPVAVKRPQFGSPPAQQLVTAVCASLDVAPASGLPLSVAEARLREYGPNAVDLGKGPGYWAFFFKEIYEPPQLLLLGVGVLYALFGGLSEAATAFAVIILMATAEVFTEWRAKRAVGALASSTPKYARVRRGGRTLEIGRTDVVPGDVVLLKAGDEIPADLRLLDTLFLEIDESSLSGEPAPVPKDASAVQSPGEDPGLLDCPGMAIAGTVVTRGKGTGVAVSTGGATAMGGMMALVKKAKEKKTPLQALLKQVAGTLSLVAIGLSGGAALAGLVRGQPWETVLLTFLSLLFATIPEELPILIAATLAVSAQALSSRNIFVKKLRAAESLAYVDTIITDKTGTLTHNRLRLTAAWAPGKGDVSGTSMAGGNGNGKADSCVTNLIRAWLFMAEIGDESDHLSSANGSSPFDTAPLEDSVRDAGPLDTFDLALTKALSRGVRANMGSALSVNSVDVQELWREKRAANLTDETPFDSGRKMSSRTFESKDTEEGTRSTVFLKGAPERLLERCREMASNGEATREIERAAKAGLRLIGYASSDVSENGPFDFLGFLAFEDPVRADAAAAVALCEGAGIRVIVASGDHVSTVATAAVQVGIGARSADDIESGTACPAVDCQAASLGNLSSDQVQELVAENRVFGRATPADKLRLLTALQEKGHVVLTTGDGTNDAPILATADVGLAMGRGTDVARAACSIVLVDDAFAGVTDALREGRRMFANLRKALAFYLGAKAGLLAIFAAGSLVSQFPLRPLHRAAARFFDREMLTWIATSAGCMAGCVLACYGYGLARLDASSAQTLAFLAWLCGHVLLALNMRTLREPLFLKGLLSNPGMVLWFVAAFALAAGCVFVRPLADVLKLAQLDARSVGVVLGSALLLTCWIEVGKLATWHRWRRGRSGAGQDTLRQPLLQ